MFGKRMLIIAGGAALAGAWIANISGQGWLISGFLGFIGIILVGIGLVGQEE